MRKLMCILLALSVLIGMCPAGIVSAANAYSGYCGAEGDGTDISWTFDSATGTLTISGTGKMRDWRHETDYDAFDPTTEEVEYSYTPWYSYRDKILRGVISDGITVMGNFTFSGCNNLKEVSLGKDLTNIGVGGFESCTSLQSIELPSAVTYVGVGAFFNDSALVSVLLPEGLEIIYHGAFGFCKALTDIEIPSGVTAIKDLAFAHCSSLKSISIPSGVTEIEKYVFYYCTSLEHVELLGDIQKIDERAFFNCASLGSFKIPESCTSIASDAFSYCYEVVLECYSGSYGETFCKANIDKENYRVISHDFRILEVVEPTCTKQGYKVFYCSECNRYRYESYGEPSGHSMGDWAISKIASPEEDGVLIRECSACGETEQRTYLYHTPGDTDLDQRLTVYDSILILQYLAGSITFDDLAFTAGDLNLNLAIDAQDSRLLLQRLCGMDVEFPSENYAN